VRRRGGAGLSILLECARQDLAGAAGDFGGGGGFTDCRVLRNGLEAKRWRLRAGQPRSGSDAAEPLPARGPVREGLQLGFAAVDESEMRRGVRELAIAIEEVMVRRDRSKMGRARVFRRKGRSSLRSE